MRARLTALLGISVLVTCSLSSSASQATTTTATSSLLKKLVVSSEHLSGYQRSYFRLWVDNDSDGCDTREEVLLSEAISKPRAGSHCSLLGGRWKSTYDNLVVSNSKSLDIDHMVPLSEAWQSGAFRWDAKTREAFANDLGFSRSLIAVSARTNRAKGDKDPYLWMPPNRSYWCQYINDWIAIKYRWGLTIDSNEKRDLNQKVSSCGKKGRTILPALATRHFTTSNSSSSTTHSNSSTESHGSGLDPRFTSCAKAKSAGYGPYYRGRDTEYSWYRDGDADGIACE